MNDTEHSCRLYLAVTHDAGSEIAGEVEAALGGGDVACVLLRAGADGRAGPGLAERLSGIARKSDTAFLIEHDVVLAQSVQADGVHVEGDGAIYDAARGALGRDAIVGVACGLSRHTAITLAEKGADYVAFGAEPGMDAAARDEMVSWWAEIVETPVVAWCGSDMEEAGSLAALGADFVAVDSAVWDHAGGAADAVARLTAAMARKRNAA